ncbi:hypothetical protein RQP46_006660 [Phenoliferia psychrophenolica]
MSTEIDQAFLAGKDAASKEREDRLENARKKLKKYRARQSKSSLGSTSSTISTMSRRDSLTSSGFADPSGPLIRESHRRSVSKSALLAGVMPPATSAAAKGHGRRASKSRGSRGASFGGSAPSGHGHTRSRASISISVSGPSTFSAGAGGPAVSDAATKAALGAPASWNGTGSFPASPAESGSATPLPSSATSESHQPTPMSASSSHASHASNASLSSAAAGPSHSRRPSRHSRRSSVANFRESMEIVSGGVVDTSLLQPSVGSFSATTPTSASDAPSSPALSARSVSPGFPTDPAKVLEALKERGRRETESELDAGRTRQGALEALEGRLSAPSSMIDLGSQAGGELLVAPPSPGYVGGAVQPPTSPSLPAAFSSPMIGLGLGGKRSSWSAPVLAAGAKGAMDLGVLAEEDEDEDEKDDIAPLPSPKRQRGGSPRKQRPSSLSLPPQSSQDTVAVGSPADETAPPFAARPMRLSLSLSSSASSVGTPSTAANSPFPIPPRQTLRSLTLTTPTSATDEQHTTPTSPGEKRRHSLFHSAAAASANASTSAVPAPRSPQPPQVATRGGLRSLSIGGLGTIGHSPDLSRPATRRAASTSRSAGKRSSISYKNTSMSSLASPDGPLSAQSTASRRPWRTTSISSSHSPSTPSSTIGGYAFPFAPSHGHFGGFGELEVDETDDEAHSPAASWGGSYSHSANSDDPTVLAMQITALRSQIELLKSQISHISSTHALEMAEFEKKAGEEARSMRMRIGELERQLEEGRVGRRFEVEGLSRENDQARDAIADLTEERDSLREDVDGWRSRCNKLEQAAKRDREDDSLASAQAKLIGEMRDQIYNLVAALERERGEHAETRHEVDRLLHQQAAATSSSASQGDESGDDESALGGIRGEGARRHGFQSASDGSVLSSFGRSYSGNMTEDTSMTTDLDDSFSKMSSPSSGHSSFGQAIGFPAGSKRDSELLVNSALQTLAEEDEEEDELTKEGERLRLGSVSVSTGSTDASEPMPLTPTKEPPSHHNRSDSFVRHWSFPKGSVSSVRISMDDDHSFFDLGRHASLPPLPIADSILPPFLGADLTVDESQYIYAPPHKATQSQQHFRRPSSPRPNERMVPHSRKYSGQYAPKAPPISPSAALAHSTISSDSSSRSLGRFGSLIGSFGGWSPASSVAGLPTPATSSQSLAKTTFASELAMDDHSDVFMASTRHQTPASLLHSARTEKQRYIKAAQQPVPRASRLAILDFTPICCSAEDVLLV